MSTGDTQTPETGTLEAPGGVSWLGRLALLAAIGGWAVVGGMLIWRNSASPPPVVTKPPPPPDEAPPLLVNPKSPLTLRQRADLEFDSDNPSQAIVLYHRLLDDPQIDRNAAWELRFRTALCYEREGILDAALSQFRELGREAPAPYLLHACQVAQGRVWFTQDKFNLARDVLTKVVLAPTTPPPLQADAAHWLAQVYAAKAMFEAGQDPLNSLDCLTPRPHFSLVDALETAFPLRSREAAASDASTSDAESAGASDSRPAAAPAADTASTEAAPQPGIKELYRLSSDAAQIQVSIEVQDADVAQLMRRLTAETKLSLEWSPAAESSIVGLAANASSRQLSAASLLDNLLGPLSLAWQQEGERIRISLMDELESAPRRAVQSGVAQRSLRYALTAFSDNRLVPHAYLALGNLEFLDQRWSEAESLYKQLLERNAPIILRAETLFNLAKVHLARGELEAAQRLFLRVADAARGSSLEPFGFLYAAAVLLEKGPVDEAVRHASAALRLASDDRLQAAATLTYASALVMNDNPVAANQVLFEHRVLMRTSRFRTPAAFLGAWARWKSAVRRVDRERAGVALIEAVADAAPEKFFGRHGYVMLGQACLELHFQPGAVDAFRKALDAGLTGQLGAYAALELAELELARNPISGEAQLKQLVDAPRSHSSIDAGLALARHQLQQGAHKECLETCRQLLGREANPEQLSAVLQIMGRCYHRLKEYDSAVQCFTGLLAPQDIVYRRDLALPGAVDGSPDRSSKPAPANGAGDAGKADADAGRADAGRADAGRADAAGEPDETGNSSATGEAGEAGKTGETAEAGETGVSNDAAGAPESPESPESRELPELPKAGEPAPTSGPPSTTPEAEVSRAEVSRAEVSRGEVPRAERWTDGSENRAPVVTVRERQASRQIELSPRAIPSIAAGTPIGTPLGAPLAPAPRAGDWVDRAPAGPAPRPTTARQSNSPAVLPPLTGEASEIRRDAAPLTDSSVEMSLSGPSR